MHKIDEPTFRKILEAALAQGDICNPHVLDIVTTFLVTGVAVSIDESSVTYSDMSNLEIEIDAVLFGLEKNRPDLSWVNTAYNDLLIKYPLPQTKPKPIHMKLLTTANPKIEKSIAYGYLTAGLHLAPANLSGYEVCRNRSKGCTFSCLNTAGHGAFTAVQLARIAKTKLYFEERAAFLDQLVKELSAFVRKAARKGLKPAVRLNLTSDLSWEDSGIMGLFPEIQFYDYTKVGARMVKFLEGDLPPNYHLTFSRSESNGNVCEVLAAKGGNIAAVFSCAELPPTYKGVTIVSGDSHDLRFLDPSPCYVGLVAKGRAKADKSGFVIQL